MRGLLKGESWIEGPKFLLESEKDWPSDDVKATIAAEDVEIKRDVTVNVITQDSPNATDQRLLYLADWSKLKVAVAWFIKWKKGSFEKKKVGYS